MSNIEIKISINNNKYVLNKNYNIIQACNLYDINIPRFCYHEKLSIAGNCRMCLVEVAGMLKPVASCALPIADNMQIFTNSKLVKKAREGILEFILINHPLDCPICDQGGECDLQDQSLVFGSDKGRFYEYKRSVIEKNWGPLIKTIMTRCIHCTRCVRFIDEIAGFKYLGLIGRGNLMEVMNFSNKIVLSEVSGNLIDLCPVGALTSKPYSFVARPWELISFNTIDLNDSMHVNIRVDVRDFNILRILPRNNVNLNEIWITDITRFCYDGFKNNRLVSPFFKEKDIFVLKSWSNILYILKSILNKRINFIVGNFIDIETAVLLKKISNKLGSFSLKVNLNNNNNFFNNDFRKNYIFSINLKNIEIYKNIFLFGLNLRMENPLLNIKLKFFSDKNLIKIFSICSSFNNNYFMYNFSNNILELIKIFEGKSFLNNIIFLSKTNLFLFGESFLNLFKNNFLFLNFFNYFKDKINYSFLNNNVSNILNYDLNLENSINNFFDKTYKFINFYNNKEIIYALNIDSFFFNFNKNLNNFLFIYQGHHNLKNKVINYFNILLPNVTFFERNNSFINFFGLVQKTKFILFPNKNCRTDFKILYIIFKFLNNLNINFEFLSNNFLSLNYYNFNFLNKNYNFLKFIFNNLNINSFITNIYKINQILFSSLILLNCHKEIKKKYTNFM